LTNAKFSVLLAACGGLLLGVVAADAQNPPRTIVQFASGEIRFAQRGKAYVAHLSSGRIEVSEELAGEAPLEVRTVDLQFTFLKGGATATPDVQLILTNADGPRTYDGSDLLAFTIQTSEGGLWDLRTGNGRCVFTLSRVSRGGVEGTAKCEDGLDTPVTDISFAASP